MAMTWLRRLAAVPVVLATVTATGGPADASAGFVEAKARWRGDVLTVSFREAGLEPGATTTIAIKARGTVNAVCQRAGNIVMSVRATGTAEDAPGYTAADDGSVRGVRDLDLSVHLPTAQGLNCTLAAIRSFSVVLRDLTTNAATEIRGQDPPASQGAERP
ncbi:hypothetical protein LWC34_05265 [Kibdelosporangium philippinense]|uniref:Neocarzinostatin family protein n=1 Tax=Kibdelosporangium philippinense TaxID=211113 RepID=A0ABS8Z2R5_9PSEU|nr:hypothetical protein [Kibdelosporangium philippinense]MCE7002239.1 hypothetical protein [Kibdelosporangium philippinense]